MPASSIPDAAPWVVLKFGGTSVAGRAQWQAIATLARARHDAGYRVLLVCSAVAGVTNALQALAAGSADPGPRVDDLLGRHRRLAEELWVDAGDILSEAAALLNTALGAPPGPARTAAILGLGEWLSTRLGARFLAHELDAAWVDAREALHVLPEADPGAPRAWLSARCRAGQDPALERDWAQRAAVLVCPGFVAAAADGRTALLGRGGSDTSAALLAGRLGAQRVEIWTDVPGLFSADPRQVHDARLIGRLSYAEALEMAAGGAKVVHPQAIRAAAETGTALTIHDLAHPQATGTVVTSAEAGNGPGVRAVTFLPDMAVLLLENLDTRQQVGFLARVFAAIAGQGVSVDLVATSETTTTLALNRATNHLDDVRLAALVAALEPLCTVQVFPDCACVNLVGRGSRLALARLGALADFLAERPLLMTSQSANDLSISLLVHARDAATLVQCLHDELVIAA